MKAKVLDAAWRYEVVLRLDCGHEIREQAGPLPGLINLLAAPEETECPYCSRVAAIEELTAETREHGR